MRRMETIIKAWVQHCVHVCLAWARWENQPQTLVVFSSDFGWPSPSRPLVLCCPAAPSGAAAWPACGWTPYCRLCSERPPAAPLGCGGSGREEDRKEPIIELRVQIWAQSVAIKVLYFNLGLCSLQCVGQLLAVPQQRQLSFEGRPL